MAAQNNILVDFPCSMNGCVSELITRCAKRLNLPAKKIFVEPGDLVDSIFYIHEGRTRHYMMNDDAVEKVVYILNKGWFLREGVFVDPAGHLIAERFSITELPTTIYVIDAACYERLLKHPEFAKELLRSSTAKNDMMRREIESLILDSPKMRLLNLLIASAKLAELVDRRWYRLKISYSHHDLAAIIGVNRVTISRFVSLLCKSGELRTVNHELQIRSEVVQQAQRLSI